MNALNEIHKIHKTAKKNRHAVYKNILKQCITKIKNDALMNSKQTVFYFTIPIFQLHFPDYDYQKAYIYIRQKLLSQGFQNIEKVPLGLNDNVIAIYYDPKIEKITNSYEKQKQQMKKELTKKTDFNNSNYIGTNQNFNNYNNLGKNSKSVSFNPKPILKTFNPSNKISNDFSKMDDNKLMQLQQSYISNIEKDRTEQLMHYSKKRSNSNLLNDSTFMQLRNIKTFSRNYQ